MYSKLGLGLIVASSIYISPFLPAPVQIPKLIISNIKRGLSKEISVKNDAKRKVSFIIPVFNEGKESLVKLVNNILEHKSTNMEIIISDGGSSDDTLEAAASFLNKPNVKFVEGGRLGRGQTIKTGVESSDGTLLVFVHSDVEFHGKLDEVLENVEDFTCFEFNIRSEKRNKYKLLEFTTNLRSKYLWLPYGDQTFVCTRSFYDQVGGFASLKIMEDFDFISRVRSYFLHTNKKLKLIPQQLCTATCSSRRWENKGIFKTTSLNWWFVFSYIWLKRHPDQIFAAYYGKHV